MQLQVAQQYYKSQYIYFCREFGKIKLHKYFFYIYFFQANEYQPVSEYPTYLWTNLKAATEYTFFVSACNGYTMECGEPSQAVTGTTEDGKSGPPSDVVAKCKFDNVSDMNYVEVQWTKPKLPNGVIEFYNVRIFLFFSYSYFLQ